MIQENSGSQHISNSTKEGRTLWFKKINYNTMECDKLPDPKIVQMTISSRYVLKVRHIDFQGYYYFETGTRVRVVIDIFVRQLASEIFFSFS